MQTVISRSQTHRQCTLCAPVLVLFILQGHKLLPLCIHAGKLGLHSNQLLLQFSVWGMTMERVLHLKAHAQQTITWVIGEGGTY